ncbi:MULTISPECIES: methyltransferase domain-containing protein [Moorena]|uniref:Methylase involved in ubiquinone/menaquinone biosynthesis n=1 Tax=Moorena producens 3L TaxID=489825 RepID=F4Y3G7_9CYAN|nr:MULTISPECIES: methyltransferase domain-containing protein [Moorena]EGJ28643.1 methylase involved in ubiquinone/menaquinone biosynthesis [Moorena producens 3L]NEP68913.1 methyltransferase domain-containing protein [Moorena sp. SIO3A5]NER91471.1 methyltransferase domain-containing protein [Moorena sp. SIO3A2]OLT63850.1 hypothetical protein BI334_01350 [Moorena producens 3L]
MNFINTDDLVNGLADLRVNGPVGVIGSQAKEVFALLAQKWNPLGESAAQCTYEQIEDLTSLEGQKQYYDLLILLPGVLDSVHQVEERYQKIVTLAQTLGPDGRIVVMVVDPPNLGLMERHWDDGVEVIDQITKPVTVDWIGGVRHHSDGKEKMEKTAILTRSEILLSFAAAGLMLEEDPLTRKNTNPFLGLQRFVACRGLRSQYSSGELYDVLISLPEDYKAFVLSYISPGMEVLELASGSGRFSIHLLEKGAQVTGIEIDAGMLNQARVNLSDWLKKGQLELIHGDIRRFELKRQFDFAFLSGEVLGEISEVEDRYRAFQCISTHLKPGARLLIITDNPGYYLQGGYRRTITRSRQLPDGNFVKMTEDRSYDPIGMYQMTILQYLVSSKESCFHFSHPRKTGIVLPNEIRLQAHLTGFRLVEEYANYQRDELLPSSPRAIYILEKS